MPERAGADGSKFRLNRENIVRFRFRALVKNSFLLCRFGDYMPPALRYTRLGTEGRPFFGIIFRFAAWRRLVKQLIPWKYRLLLNRLNGEIRLRKTINWNMSPWVEYVEPVDYGETASGITSAIIMIWSRTMALLGPLEAAPSPVTGHRKYGAADIYPDELVSKSRRRTGTKAERQAETVPEGSMRSG